jgi:hypothetical protein
VSLRRHFEAPGIRHKYGELDEQVLRIRAGTLGQYFGQWAETAGTAMVFAAMFIKNQRKRCNALIQGNSLADGFR